MYHRAFISSCAFKLCALSKIYALTFLEHTCCKLFVWFHSCEHPLLSILTKVIDPFFQPTLDWNIGSVGDKVGVGFIGFWAL